MEIVAGDIFDDAASTFAEAACAVNKFRTDKKVTRGAIGMAERRVHTGDDNAADSRFKIKRNGEREKLFLLVERGGEVVETDASVHADGEIAGIVMDDFVKTGHVEGDVVAGRRHADFELGAMAAGDEGEFFECGKTDDFRDLFGEGWFGDRGWSDFVNGVVRED